MYSVWNDGNLWLNNNTFDSYIYNNGSIWTKTYTYMLDNKTYNVTWMEDFNFFATIYDDTQANKIISVDTLNTTNNVYQDIGGSYILPYNSKVLKAVYQGSFLLQPSDKGLKDNTCFNGTLNVKMPLNLNLTVNYVGDDKITVTATITPVGERSNFTLQNKIIFRFNGQDYEEDINWDEVFHDPFHTWTKAVATFELNNLSAGYYKLTAMYPGDDTHEYAENLTEFEVKLRETWIKIVVENITYGSYAIANVTTNGNGTVLLFLNGRYEKYNLTEGDGYYGNYSIVNGTLIVKFDTLYGPGNYSMAAVYMEDEYYKYALNQTNFTVFKQNTTIIANATNITFWGNETINVTVDANATGYIIITIPVRGVDQNYVAEIDENGTAHFIIPNLFGGDYKNIRVFYAGDHNFNGNVTYINFTVAPTDVYDMDVKADNITYGQNATVRVLVPSLCDGNATIWVDGVNVGTVKIVNGVGVLDNVSGLAGGKHYANATYNGDANYAAKNFTNVEFNVNPTIDWKLTITVDEHAYGENTTVYVTANPYNVTNRNLTIYIGDHPYVVNITNGVATLTLSNITAGIHESHAYYSGDANYSNKTQKFRLHVVKAQPTVNLTFTNENKVIANVTGLNVTGNVTFYVNGRNVTVNVNNNIAVLENLTVGNNSVVAIYNGDMNHFRASSAENYDIDKLESFVNVTANVTVYGDVAEITVEVGENQTGFVKVIVNDEIYIAQLNGTTAKFNVTGLKVDEYLVNVTYYGDELYNSSENSTKLRIIKANMTADVVGLNVTVKQDIAFVIENITKGFNGKVKISVDGTAIGYDDIVKALIDGLGKLEAGTYTANVTFHGDANYNDKNYTVNFTVSRITPEINVTIADVKYPNNATAIIAMSNNANGTIQIYINGALKASQEIKNGAAEIVEEATEENTDE
jgi:hypothetical protein